MTFDPAAPAAPGSGIFGLPFSEEDAGVVLVPAPFEATTSYGGGTGRGPEAILAASRQVDLFDIETGRPYEPGIHLCPIPEDMKVLDRTARVDAVRVLAAGGVQPGRPDLEQIAARVDAASEQMNRWVEREVSRLLQKGKRVGLLGGDHSTAFGSIAAQARAHPDMGILHLDAHADLRPAYEGFTWSHASIMYNVAEKVPAVSRIVQVGIRDLSEEERDFAAGSKGRIRTHFDSVLAQARFEGESWGAQVRRIVEELPPEVYLSFDIDALDPGLCPHTGTPVPGGLSFQEAVALVAGVVRSGRRMVGFDLVEVAPGPEGDEWDGNVGARVLYKLIGWMLRSHP